MKPPGVNQKAGDRVLRRTCDRRRDHVFDSKRMIQTGEKEELFDTRDGESLAQRPESFPIPGTTAGQFVWGNLL